MRSRGPYDGIQVPNIIYMGGAPEPQQDVNNNKQTRSQYLQGFWVVVLLSLRGRGSTRAGLYRGLYRVLIIPSYGLLKGILEALRNPTLLGSCLGVLRSTYPKPMLQLAPRSLKGTSFLGSAWHEGGYPCDATLRGPVAPAPPPPAPKKRA